MTSFSNLVMQVHTELGGRASADDVAIHVKSVLGEETYHQKVWRGFVAQCAAVLRQRSPETGLPEAPCINGEYIQDALLTSEELRYLAVQSFKRGQEHMARAQAYARRHLDVYGIAIDPSTGEVLAS